MSQFPYPLDSSWRQIHDPARGARRVRYDARGRIVEAGFATGRSLSLVRDTAGNLRRIDELGQPLIAIDPPSKNQESLRVTDPQGVTEVSWRGGECKIERDSRALLTDTDRQGRLVRVEIPDCVRALVYSWEVGGSCLIALDDGTPLVQVTTHGLERRIACAAGDWEELNGLGVFRIVPRGESRQSMPSVEIEHDVLGHTRERRWSDGWREVFHRDESGRMSEWARTGPGPRTRVYEYAGEHVRKEVRDGVALTRSVDAAGRVLSVHSGRELASAYAYDESGRRISRAQSGRETRYEYDAFGQLTAVENPDGERIVMHYDGLGRRIKKGEQREHRDASGRLWSVTDSCGKTLHTYIWFEHRLIARIDGPLGQPVSEAFLCDPHGTLLAVLRDRKLERNDAPPYGASNIGNRPTLYGHLADPFTGLIHFGGREYDPEIGCFLTPDPWHGAEDDPRLWGGQNARQLAAMMEMPASGIHPYALCQFDPAGMADYDGHKAELPSTAGSVLNGIATVLLAPTWGMPLTAISLFFFLPIDIYMEVIGLIVTAISSIASSKSGFWANHPWENNSIFRSTWLLGSSRQGIAAFGLNGFLPRVVSGKGISSDRAVTIGNVVWINSEELNRMERPTVLELDNLTGLNTNPAIPSILHISGAGKKGKRFYCAYWTRGFGNSIKAVAGAPEEISFNDAAPPGGSAKSSVHLAKPFPFDFPVKAPLEAREYTFPAAGKQAEAEVVMDNWFAIQLPKKSGLKAGDAIEITPKGDQVHTRISLVFTDPEFDLAILSAPLPATLTDGSFKVDKIIDKPGAVNTPGWVQDGGNQKLKVAVPTPAGPFESLAIHSADLVKITPPAAAAPPAPPPGAPAIGAEVYSRVKDVTNTLKLSVALKDPAPAGADVFNLEEDKDSGHGFLPDASVPEQMTWTVDKGGISEGDLVFIRAILTGKTTYALVKKSDGDKLTIELLAPKLDVPNVTDCVIKKLNNRGGKGDKASVTAAGNDNIVVKLGLTTTFKPKALLHFQLGNKHQIGELASVSGIAIELTDAIAAAGPYGVMLATRDESVSTIKGATRTKVRRFLKHTGVGTKPSGFGAYPAVVHNIGPQGLVHAFHQISGFFANTAAAGFDPDFRGTWKPATVGADEYFVLDSDLPIAVETEENAKTKLKEHIYYWAADPDSRSPNDRIQFKSEPAATAIRIIVELFEFTSNPGSVFNNFGVSEARVLVPEHPLVADTHADALREHELHHAQQNTHWGAFMGALPIGGIQTLIVDAAGTKNNNPPSWLSDENAKPEAKNKMQEFQGAQWASVGALMELAWSYLFLGFAFAPKWRFSDWNRIFNPVFGNLIAALDDQIDPNEPLNQKPGFALLQILATLTDLRSWVPFIGWVPLILPDGARSFLEQGASRASGDLYSTILSADDKFNRESDTRGFLPDIVPDYHTANVTKSLGEVTRLMIFPGERSEKVIAPNRANAPAQKGVDRSIGYFQTFRVQEIVSITPKTQALLHPLLFEAIGGVAPTLDIDGPPSQPAKASFLQVTGVEVRPKLRAFTPVPPQVNRTAGFYFIPGSPAVYDFKAFFAGDKIRNTHADGTPDDSNDAGTQNVTLTIKAGEKDNDDKDGKIGEVTLDGEKVAYAQPPPSGGAGAASSFNRFVSETIALKVTGQVVNGKQWELDLCGATAASPPPRLPAAGIVTPKTLADGWEIQLAGKMPAGAALPLPVRVRLFRIFKKNDITDDTKNDPEFDLAFPEKKYPTLKNVRSYLEQDIWIPVRDFVFTIEDLPELTADGKPVTIDTESEQKLDLGLALKGDVKPVITPRVPAPGAPRPVAAGAIPVPQVERITEKSAHPRGEKWRLKPLGVKLAASAVYDVSVTFGKAPNSVERKLQVTIEPKA